MRSVRVNKAAIRRTRELAGYTQGQVAKRIGVDRSAVCHWESERSPKQPTGTHFKALCRVLRVKPESLLAGCDEAA
ncbi:helix-turn-helix transcriptional regulator [Mycobacterium sp.]|uniref:helix-turn-helix transcriptional regulator n=1 Tax=Mycobacterium sp. TaxID=1785 RepID=UPI00344BB95C